jgi:hypothetical protein
LVMMFCQLILMSSSSALPPMSLSLAPNGVPEPQEWDPTPCSTNKQHSVSGACNAT